MIIVRTTRFIGIIMLLLAARFLAEAHDPFTDTDAIKSFLRENFASTNAGMVIGLVDEHGSRTFSAGKLDNGTTHDLDGDTVFEIGSITKTFSSLLMLDMARRGEMNLDDSVAEYLPKSVKVPAHVGKEITLLNLAAQDSGLPFNADNLSSKDWVKAFNAYTAADMYAFLSGYTLAIDPGAKFQYSNLGMSLLGHVMELKAGTNFELLVVDRICRPLQMDSTGIKLTREQRARMVTGHDENGQRAAYYDFQVMAGAGALCSTASDLLKYVAANLGLTKSPLWPLMERSQVIRHTDSPDMGKTAMPWYDQAVYNPPGTELLGHGGGTGGCSAFIGFDKRQGRGVVVLSNQKTLHSSPIGWAILQRMPLTRASGTEFVREIVGLGTALESDQKNGLLRITKVIPKSPAAEAGLLSGSFIRRINGISVEGKSLGECLGLMGGPAGTKVRLELVNPELKEANTFELMRQKFLTLN